MAEVDFSMPPPVMGDQFPNNSTINIGLTPPPFGYRYGNQQNKQFRPFQPKHNNQLLNSLPDDFDGKRLRKSNMRKTVDYNCAIARALQGRVWQRDHRDRHVLQPDCLYIPDLVPPPYYLDNPINAVTTRFVKTATNKMRCPIFCMAWTPEGRRLVTGASSGEFTLWNGLTFNFETILQAHDSPVRSMVWSHNDCWMITGDHTGYCKYWQSNMNNVKMFQAHKEAIRGLSFSPTDQKIVSCSDDGTLRIWDFATTQEERVLRGHGSDVKCCGWHPYLGLIASGSKDNQQPIKLWDPKTGNSLATLHAHKSTVMDLKWNKNGNWFITASRDHFLKLFDIRQLSQPVQTFRGHKKEASCIAWHPFHEGLLASGGSDGAILFWHVGADKEVGSLDQAHDSIVWCLDWHPLGHILCSGSNDHTSKFWTRNRPGDKMRDKYNLNLIGQANDDEIGEAAVIPGMAPEDRIDSEVTLFPFRDEGGEAKIPGLSEEAEVKLLQAKDKLAKKQPYAKPIPKNFMASWNETSMMEEDEELAAEGYGTESVLEPIHNIVNQLIEARPGVKKLEDIMPRGLVAFGRVIPVRPHSKLYRKILQGQDALLKYLTSGKVREFQDLPGFDELGMLYESDSDSSKEDEGTGSYPSREELNIDRLDLNEFLVPFNGFVEADLDDVPYRDKESRNDVPPRGFGRDDDDVQSNRGGRWDDDDRWERSSRRDRRRGRDRYDRGGSEESDRGDFPPNNMMQGGGFMGPMGGPMGPMGFNVGPNMMNNMGNFGPNFGPGQMGNFCGPGNFGPNMGGPNMGPGNMGSPNMGPGNMGGPNMGPGNMGGPNMGPGNMSGPNMRPGNMGGPNMGPGTMGGPNMGPGNMGGPNMGPGTMGGPNMGPGNMGGPNMGPGNNMGPGGRGGSSMGNMGPGNNMGGPGPNLRPGNMMNPNMGVGNMVGPNNMGPGIGMGGGPNMGPGSNMGSGRNMSGRNMNMTGPNANMVNPGMNVGGPNVNMGSPGMNAGPNMNMGGPGMNMNMNPAMRMGGPGMNMGGPGMMGGPNMNMGGNFGPGGRNMGPGGPGNFGGSDRVDEVDDRWVNERKRRFDDNDDDSFDDSGSDDGRRGPVGGRGRGSRGGRGRGGRGRGRRGRGARGGRN